MYNTIYIYIVRPRIGPSWNEPYFWAFLDRGDSLVSIFVGAGVCVRADCQLHAYHSLSTIDRNECHRVFDRAPAFVCNACESETCAACDHACNVVLQRTVETSRLAI